MPFIVFNIHANPDYDWCDEVVNVMRPNLLGNPFFVLDQTYEARRRVLQTFRTYLKGRCMLPSDPVAQEIKRLNALHREGKTIALVCCCSPRACHADVIKEICSK